jgi:hypothetical protein
MMTKLEIEIDNTCDILDVTIDEIERKILEAKLFELVEQLNGNTIYLTVQ